MIMPAMRVGTKNLFAIVAVVVEVAVAVVVVVAEVVGCVLARDLKQRSRHTLRTLCLS